MDDSLDEIFDTGLTDSYSYYDEESLSEDCKEKEEEEESVTEKEIKKPKRVFTESEIGEIMRVQKKRLSEIKKMHLSEEKTLAETNDLKYRDFIWELTLSNFGRGSFPNDLRPLFEKKLIDEEYRMKKEIFDLQESQKEELRTAKNASKDAKMYANHCNLPNPKDVAEQIFMQLQSAEGDDDEDDSMIDKILNKVRTANSVVIEKPHSFIEDSDDEYDNDEAIFSPPKRVKSTPRHSSYISPHVYERERTPPRSQKKPNRILRRHIIERNKLKKSIEETDKFMYEMKRQVYLGEYT